MKTIKISMVAMVVAATVGCGGQEVSYDEMPEPTQTESPAPTPIPNAAPETPALTASKTLARAGETVTIEASSSDPDGDAIAFEWTAEIEDAGGVSDLVLHFGDGSATFAVPVTSGLGTVRVFCQARDARDARSSAAEATVTVNPIVIDDENFDDRLGTIDICRVAPELCGAFPHIQESVLDTYVPDVTDIRDEYVGATTSLPYGDFHADLDVSLSPNGQFLANLGTGSIDMIVGANGKGGGYRLRLFTVAAGLFGSAQWKYEILPLASNSFEAQTVLDAVAAPILTGSIAKPYTLSVVSQDGMLQFSVNGTALPAFAATNVKGTTISMGTYQSSASFSNVQVTMLK